MCRSPGRLGPDPRWSPDLIFGFVAHIGPSLWRRQVLGVSEVDTWKTTTTKKKMTFTTFQRETAQCVKRSLWKRAHALLTCCWTQTNWPDWQTYDVIPSCQRQQRILTLPSQQRAKGCFTFLTAAAPGHMWERAVVSANLPHPPVCRRDVGGCRVWCGAGITFIWYTGVVRFHSIGFNIQLMVQKIFPLQIPVVRGSTNPPHWGLVVHTPQWLLETDIWCVFQNLQPDYL